MSISFRFAEMKLLLLNLLNGFILIVVVLFVLDAFSGLELIDQHLKTITYFGVILLPPLALLANILLQKKQSRKVIFSLIYSMVIVGVLVIGPTDIVFSSSVWKTQTILYKHVQKSNMQIEFQMQDVGAHGYNRRTVKVTPFLVLFRLIKPCQNLNELGPEWKRVDIELNQQELKGG